MRNAECGLKTLLRPKGQKDLVEEPVGFDDDFLTERGAQTRFRPRSLSDLEVGFFTEARWWTARAVLERKPNGPCPSWARFFFNASRNCNQVGQGS
jgi:hypothetical protein